MFKLLKETLHTIINSYTFMDKCNQQMLVNSNVYARSHILQNLYTYSGWVRSADSEEVANHWYNIYKLTEQYGLDSGHITIKDLESIHILREDKIQSK